jgi:hypothetical protein
MEPTEVIAAWTASDTLSPVFPALLRMARPVPDAQAYLRSRLSDPLDLALAGLGPPPKDEQSLGRRVLSALAACDAGSPPAAPVAAALEAEAIEDPDWWIHAARVHVLADISRERAARSRLADQSLPYVFPGEIHPVMVDLLSAGDRVLPALHVDWTRKLTRWVAEDLLGVDCERRAMWFWPVLGAMEPGRLVLPLARIGSRDSMPEGALGLAAAYCQRVGAPVERLQAKCGEVDKLLLALARVGAQRREA